MPSCRVCSCPLLLFQSFGAQPLANAFLTPEQIPQEAFFEMTAAYCPTCFMVQLVDQPAPSDMFHDHYAFYSSTSAFMATHFAAFAQQVTERYLTGKGQVRVVEVGCNDGILLKHFLKPGFEPIGIEPSANVADVARKAGLHVKTDFFSEALAKQIVAEGGRVHAVLSANVMNHIPDMNAIFRALAILLTDDGVAVFEDPYLGAVLETTEYDQFYDEHVFLYSAQSMQSLAARHGFVLVDCEPQETHGGSMRYTLARAGQYPATPRVTKVLADEVKKGFNQSQTYEDFSVRVEASRKALVGLLQKLKSEGKQVVGYAATAKSTTVTNFCKIGPDLLPVIFDTTPLKQGKLNPGQHIPVRDMAEFSKPYPDYAVLFAHNHKREIFQKEKAFLESGGKWILFVPDVRVLGKGDA